MKRRERRSLPKDDNANRAAINDEVGFSGWDEVAAFYSQQKRAKAKREKPAVCSPQECKRKQAQSGFVSESIVNHDKLMKMRNLVESSELRSEIKVTVKTVSLQNNLIYVWRCSACAENGMVVCYETESFLSVRLHAVYHFLESHPKDRKRLLAEREKLEVEKNLQYLIVINSRLEEKLRGQQMSDVDLASICIEDHYLVPLLLECFNDLEKKEARVCFCYKICFGMPLMRQHCEEEHGLIPRLTSTESKKVVSDVSPLDGGVSRNNYDRQAQSTSQNEDNVTSAFSFPMKSENSSDNCEPSAFPTDSGTEAEKAFQCNARSTTCRHCKMRILSSCKTGCRLRLVYHCLNDHKGIEAVALEAERERSKLEDLLETKLDFSDRSQSLENTLGKVSKAYLATWLARYRIKDPKVIGFLRKESFTKGEILICFCYRIFAHCERFLGHVRKMHMLSRSESKCVALPGSSTENATGNTETIDLTPAQSPLNGIVDSWLKRYSEELGFREKVWFVPYKKHVLQTCFLCKRALVASSPKAVKHDAFMHLHIMYHLSTTHSDDKRASDLVDFGRSLWKERLGIELNFCETLPSEIRNAFNAEECLKRLFELNLRLLETIEDQSGIGWNRKDVVCFCYRVMREKVILKHLRDEHSFHIWRCDIIPNSRTEKPFRCYCRCYFCKAYISCDYSELALRLVAFIHLRKQHGGDTIAAEYCERERIHLESCLKTDLKVLPELPKCSRLLSASEARELYSVREEAFVSAIKASAFQGIPAPDEAVICGCYHTLFNEGRFKQHMKAIHNINVKRKRSIYPS